MHNVASVGVVRPVSGRRSGAACIATCRWVEQAPAIPWLCGTRFGAEIQVRMPVVCSDRLQVWTYEQKKWFWNRAARSH
jgi:hypothetical protein